MNYYNKQNKNKTNHNRQTKWLHNKTDSILNAPIGTLLTNHTKLNNSFDSLGSENSSTRESLTSASNNLTTSLRPVLKSWAQQCSCQGATVAMQILRRLLIEEEYYMNMAHEKIALATTAIYSSVMDALAKSGCVGQQLQCEALLNEMFVCYNNDRSSHAKPNTVAFNATLDAYAKMSLPDLDGSPNSRQRHGKNLKACKASCCGYYENNNKQISSLSYTGVAERAEQLLNWMHRLSEENNDSKSIDVKPDAISYNTVLVCFSRANLVKRVQALHNRMENYYNSDSVANSNLRPNTHTLTTVCNAWARSGKDGAALQCTKILERMEHECFVEGIISVKPNVKTYTCVIDAWAKASMNNKDGPLRAEAILNRMEQKQDASIRPNVQSYAAVLDAWAKSKYTNKSIRAHAIVDRMRKVYESTGDKDVRPNVFCYTAVINAAGFTDGSKEDKNAALLIACNTLEELQNSEYGPPNHVTYTTFLKACANLMEVNVRQRVIAEHVFDLARNNGQVSKNLFNQYKRIMIKHNVRVEGIDGDILPQSWSCNVKERQYGYGSSPPRSRKNIYKNKNSESAGRSSPRSSMSLPSSSRSASPLILNEDSNRHKWEQVCIDLRNAVNSL